MDLDLWPKCAVPACQNKCCLRLRSIYCWPHTPGSADEARRTLMATEAMDAFDGEPLDISQEPSDV